MINDCMKSGLEITLLLCNKEDFVTVREADHLQF